MAKVAQYVKVAQVQVPQGEVFVISKAIIKLRFLTGTYSLI